jgi:hypothetical protein
MGSFSFIWTVTDWPGGMVTVGPGVILSGWLPGGIPGILSVQPAQRRAIADRRMKNRTWFCIAEII